MASDREVLRGLAGRVAEVAASDRMRELESLWRRHNSLQGDRPMICVSPEGCWREILREEDLQCQDPVARGMEYALRQKLFWAQEIGDDTPISGFFDVPHVLRSTFYLEGEGDNQVRVSDTGSFHYARLIDDLEEGLTRLRFREVTCDRQAGEDLFTAAQDAFGDLLQVRYRGSHWWTMGLTAEVIRLIGLEELMVDMYDDPENLHRLMAWFRDEHMHFITRCEDLGVLTLNNGDDIIASGGIGYTDELGAGEGPVRLSQLWGFAESQETVGISPQMFGEFIFPYQLPLLERFGLNCYGCCEPVEQRWEWIRQIPRLRRLSVSPWSDQEKMAGLLGKEYIFSRKPNPAPVCVGFDQEEIKRDLAETARLAPRVCLEVILKDTHTVEGHPERLGQWVQMARRALG